ncbi:sterol desaturase family protein [Hyphomonas sp. FCG-A18]|uniref:sterol desaturase family protein n=1 Tax=Hyphomonas sp. FCG-A18 TaxID=3080019 RepID=UPI002B28E705|nr:sterol desaturase family protein [Hyphomonas sp. FCG-A18]
MEVTSFFTEYLGPRILSGLQTESIRYALGTLTTFFVIWLLLGRLLENRRIRKPLPRQRQIKQVQMELKNSFFAMAVFVGMDILVFEAANLGLFKKYDDISEYGLVWFWLSMPLLIIFHDTYFYWTHRAMHHPKLYKLFHMTHHRSHNPTPFTAYSFAPLEAIVSYLYVPLALMVIPTHGIALYTVLTIMIFKNAIGHCGYEVFPRHWAKLPVLGWLTTVTHHDMHHERGNGNFGLYFTLWDRWMGTEHANYLQRLEDQEDRARERKHAHQEAAFAPAE